MPSDVGQGSHARPASALDAWAALVPHVTLIVLGVVIHGGDGRDRGQPLWQGR